MNINKQIYSLKFFPTAEGYYDFIMYNYTDHLGNIG